MSPDLFDYHDPNNFLSRYEVVANLVAEATKEALVKHQKQENLTVNPDEHLNTVINLYI